MSAKSFVPKLQDHVLTRLSGDAYEGEDREFQCSERNSVRFTSNRLYFHRTLRVNYTTYDLQRSQDVINPTAHADVMVLSHEDEQDDPHPYWYARVISIFHVNVYRTPLDGHPGTRPERMDVLWVRWLGRDPEAFGGMKAKRLPKIGFVPFGDGEPFGFLDPRLVIRGAHIMPAFADGRTTALLPKSLTRTGQNKREEDESVHDTDYLNYYVNMCVSWQFVP